MLRPWVDQFSFILEQPVQPEDPDDWSIRAEVGICFHLYLFSCFVLLAHDSKFPQVLKCLNQFVQNFPSFTEIEFMGELVISLFMFLLAIF